nr:putative reverse transcriptase domain-containing protein [Tanacetum cinerariifolium]
MIIDDINELQDPSNLLAMHLSNPTPSTPILPHTITFDQQSYHSSIPWCPKTRRSTHQGGAFITNHLPWKRQKWERPTMGGPLSDKGADNGAKEISMENVPRPNDNLNAPEEEPFMDQAPTAFVGFAPQWIGEQIMNNNNGWLEEEPEEEEEEDEAIKDDKEDDAEMTNPLLMLTTYQYLLSSSLVIFMLERAQPREIFLKAMTKNGQAFDITALDSAVRENRSESSKMMRLIMDLSRDFSELKSQNRRAEELSHWEAWVRGRIPNSLRFQEEPSIHIAPVPRADDPYVMVRDAARGTREDEDDNTVALRDTQPPESCGSPRDSHECAKVRKVKFATATLHGRALTWWNSQVATLSREVANARSWAEVKQMMTDEFCPTEEVQRLEDELRHLKLRDMNIPAYTERFNKLALLCPDAVPNEKKKVELYIKGLPEIIKGETTSSRPVTLNEAVRMAHALMEQKI